MLGAFGVAEDAGDQESREDEEEVHADPAEVGDGEEDPAGEGMAFGLGGEMGEEDEEDRQAAEAVEGGDAVGGIDAFSRWRDSDSRGRCRCRARHSSAVS
jgi:hypothetical protein